MTSQGGMTEGRGVPLAIAPSATVEWGTPLEMFRQLDAEFGFTVDVCASPVLAKCSRFYTVDDDGLAQSWAGETCWMNPPYGDDPLWRWMERAEHARKHEGATVVALVPCRTGSRWWLRWVWDNAANAPRPGITLRFIPGRITFQGAPSSAPFPCALVVFTPQSRPAIAPPPSPPVLPSGLGEPA